MEEFNLSGKIQEECFGNDRIDIIPKEDVKEFIKRLKEEIEKDPDICMTKKDEYRFDKILGKLAGDKLK